MIDGATAVSHLCTNAASYLETGAVVPGGRDRDIEETQELLRDCAEWLREADPGADVSATPVAPEESGLPVLRRFGYLLRAGQQLPKTHTPLAELIEAARAVASLAAWSPFYGDSQWSRPFLDRFAVGPLVGPRAPFQRRGLIVDLFLYGPRIHYPLHAHPAREVYLPLYGAGEFRIGSAGRPIHVPPGTAVVHQSDEPHGVTVGEGPVFGLTFLRGDLEAPTWYRSPMSDTREAKICPPLV